MDKLSPAQMLAALDRLQAMLSDLPDRQAASAAMDAFTREAETVQASVHDEDQPDFRHRVQCMLCDAGLIPGDGLPRDATGTPPDDDAVSQ